MGNKLTKQVDNECELIRYNSFGFKDPKGKYILYDDHVDKISILGEMNGKLYDSLITIVHDAFK